MRKLIVLADLIDSRKVTARKEQEDKTMRILTLLGSDKSVSFFSHPSTIKGIDEIGWALHDTEHLWATLQTFLFAMHPARFRFAIVLDNIDQHPEGTPFSRLDGKAFHIAADAMNQRKKATLPIAFYTGFKNTDVAVMGMLNSLVYFHYNWTEKENQLCKLYKKMGHQNQVAEKLSLTQQSVSAGLQRASWQYYTELEQLLYKLL